MAWILCDTTFSFYTLFLSQIAETGKGKEERWCHHSQADYYGEFWVTSWRSVLWDKIKHNYFNENNRVDILDKLKSCTNQSPFWIHIFLSLSIDKSRYKSNHIVILVVFFHIPSTVSAVAFTLAITVMTVPFPLISSWNGISIFTLQVYLSESFLVILIKVILEQSDVSFCREPSEFFNKISLPIIIWFFSQLTLALSNFPVKQQVKSTFSPSLTKTSELWVTRILSDEAPIKKQSDM